MKAQIIPGDDFPPMKFVAKFAVFGALCGLAASAAAHLIAGVSFYLEATVIGAVLGAAVCSPLIVHVVPQVSHCRTVSNYSAAGDGRKKRVLRITRIVYLSHLSRIVSHSERQQCQLIFGREPHNT